MTQNNNNNSETMNIDDDEYQQEEPSSRHLLFALEDLLERSHSNTIFISRTKHRSKSVDDLFIHHRRRYRQNSPNDVNNISNRTLIGLDLSSTEYNDDDDDDLQVQRSRSAPVLPAEFYDKELAAFIQCEQQHQQSIGDSFVYNIDLSDSNETSQLNSRLAVFFEDDFSEDEINYEPSTSFMHSSLINNCLTITEENEDELEELNRDNDEEQQQRQYQRTFSFPTNQNSKPTIILFDDDDDQTILYENENPIEEMNDLIAMTMDHREDSMERLSTIYESPSPQPDIDEEETIDDDTYDKLIIYDIANIDKSTKLSIIHPISESTISTTLSYRSPITTDRTRIDACSKLTNTLPVSRLCGTTTMITSKVYNPSPLTTNNNENFSSSPVINADIIPSFKPHSSSPVLFPNLTNKQTVPSERLSQHIKTMRVIQSSLSSLSDFISSPSKSTLPNTIYYDEVPNVHHSLIDCSLTHPVSAIINDRDRISNKQSNNQERRTSFTPRILTNGLLLTHCASNPIPRRAQELPASIDPKHSSTRLKYEDKFLSDTSSSSELLSSSDDKLLSRSEYLLREEQNTSQQRKASSLKSISITSSPPSSKILYPIDFEMNHPNISWHQKRSSDSTQVRTFDSGIIIDTQPTSKSSIDEDASHDSFDLNQLKYYEINYHKTLNDLTVIKKNIVDTESRLNEVMRELEIEHALIEGEHELVFKQILDASESDQQNLRQLHQNLELLLERIMTEKTSIRNEIGYTQQILFKLEQELYNYEEHYRSSDERILRKKEMIAGTRQKYEDLEFQLMELETRCESELEQAEEHFRNEQKLVTQNAKIRQNTLRELDHQQYMALYQATIEKEKLEREKQRLKLIYKQKKIEANEFERKLHDTWSDGNDIHRTIYQSTPLNLYKSMNYRDEISSSKITRTDDHQEKLNEMLVKMKLEKMTTLEQQLRERYDENIKRLEMEQKLADEIQNQHYQVKLREKTRTQERPLTRYLPIRSADFDLRAHIEGAGHFCNSPHLSLTSTTCRGYLHKMGGMKFKTWNRRWFVFDRQHRSLSYYHDKNEIKLRGSIDFQSILEVYIDQLQSISLRSPEPRDATFIVKTIQRSYYLVAPTVESMRIWIDVMITGAEGNTFASG